MILRPVVTSGVLFRRSPTGLSFLSSRLSAFYNSFQQLLLSFLFWHAPPHTPGLVVDGRFIRPHNMIRFVGSYLCVCLHMAKTPCPSRSCEKKQTSPLEILWSLWSQSAVRGSGVERPLMGAWQMCKGQVCGVTVLYYWVPCGCYGPYGETRPTSGQPKESDPDWTRMYYTSQCFCRNTNQSGTWCIVLSSVWSVPCKNRECRSISKCHFTMESKWGSKNMKKGIKV